jgi:TRAP-type C4-dicarboxylate transport system permease small subunit
VIDRLSALWGRLLSALALLGCLLLLAMMLIIVADVALRNLALAGWPRGLAWSNEVSEWLLLLVTLCVAPWLLRQGQHIRVDVLLQPLPPRWAWLLEWLGDVLGLATCLVLTAVSAKAALASHASGALSIKTLVTPEWWSLAPMPLAFALLSVEMLFRMHRLWRGERGPRSDAVSAA